MDDTQIFQLPGVILSDKSMANGARRFTIETQEALSPDMLHRLITLENKIGWFTFMVKMIEAQDVIDLPEIDKSKYPQAKTPGQRLRGALFALHESKGGKKENFTAFYDTSMEQFISMVKAKIDND